MAKSLYVWISTVKLIMNSSLNTERLILYLAIFRNLMKADFRLLGLSPNWTTQVFRIFLFVTNDTTVTDTTSYKANGDNMQPENTYRLDADWSACESDS